jgi:hypothetical protein
MQWKEIVVELGIEKIERYDQEIKEGSEDLGNLYVASGPYGRCYLGMC